MKENSEHIKEPDSIESLLTVERLIHTVIKTHLYSINIIMNRHGFGGEPVSSFSIPVDNINV